MGRNDGLVSKESAEHRAHIRASIGRRLRETYNVEVPLTARLAELMRRIEESASESAEHDRAGSRT
jgi:hypothetical protein